MAVLLWVIFSIIVALAANHWGRNGVYWFFISILISPLLASVLVFLLPAKLTQNDRVKCPECRELILIDARLCKHCNTKLIPQ